MRQLQLQCAKCDAVMPHSQDTPNHVAHAVGALLTAGLWLPMWLLVALTSGNEVATCSRCGNRRQPDGAATIASGKYKTLSARGWMILIGVTAVGTAALLIASEYLDI